MALVSWGLQGWQWRKRPRIAPVAVGAKRRFLIACLVYPRMAAMAIILATDRRCFDDVNQLYSSETAGVLLFTPNTP